MDITPYLDKQCIRLDSSAKNKEEALHEIATLATNNPSISEISEEEIFEKLKAREQISTTGFGKGIAIPHCFIDSLETFVIGVLISKDGVDFSSIDGSLTRIMVFIVGPKNRRNEHISILSGFSKMLMNNESVEFFLSAESVDNVYRFIVEHLRFTKQKPNESSEKCLFHVFIQEEDLFDDILQLFSATVGGELSVVESYNAGYYLHAIPIYAALWTEQAGSFNKIVIAIVEKSHCNDIIRQINTIAPSDQPGVMVAVQELFYASGSLNL